MTTFKSILFAMMLAILMTVCSTAPNNQEFSLKIPDECKGHGFCTIKPEGYDDLEDLIESLLHPMFIEQHNIENRVAETEDLNPLENRNNCPSRKTVVESAYSYIHPNHSDPDIIIQHKLLRQPIIKNECAYDQIDVASSEQCFQDLSLSAFNMKTRCESVSVMRSLFVLNVKTKKLVKRPYPIPCCCICKVERT